MTINFQLGGHSEEFVQTQLDAGRYSDATEVVRDALRLMEEHERAIALHRDELARKIEAGYQSLQEGRHCDGDEFMAELDAELDAIDREAR